MLRTVAGREVWFVSQPDHAEVSGYLAAHWGNEAFTRPGYYAPSVDAETLRSEVVLAIAQHDNGWWEWEAEPSLSPEDGLPVDLVHVLGNRQEGMERWRRGIPRFREQHPYVSLLIAWHAYWLHAPALETEEQRASDFLHPLFSGQQPHTLTGDARVETAEFVAELQRTLEALETQLSQQPETSAWVAPEAVRPQIRLLQVLDAVSLSLCSTLIPAESGPSQGQGRDAYRLAEVPRRSNEDLVTIQVRPLGERRLAFDPYPFDCDPLPVRVPTRRIVPHTETPSPYPLAWYAQPLIDVEYTFCSSD